MRIRNIKFTFHFIPKSDYLILDNPGANLIRKTLKKNIPILSTRESRINLFILFFSIFSFSKYKLGQKYLISYIRMNNPKVIISHIDNNNFFYSLKKIFPKIKFIFIQNGISLASKKNSEIKKLNWKADYFFSYSESYRKRYYQIFKSKVFNIGSFKNNLKKINKNINKKSLVFISQIPLTILDKNNNFNERFYKSEKILIPLLFSFCEQNDFNFIVAGRFNKKKSQIEKSFYDFILSQNRKKYIFKSQHSEFSSYNLIDNANLVVFIDSALGYQSLARGNKTLGICLRSYFTSNKNLNFGWPFKFKDEGPFWINKFNKKKILMKLKYLKNLNDNQWNKIYDKYSKNLLTYDYGNKNFKDCFNQISKKIKNEINKQNI